MATPSNDSHDLYLENKNGTICPVKCDGASWRKAVHAKEQGRHKVSLILGAGKSIEVETAALHLYLVSAQFSILCKRALGTLQK